MAKKVKENPVKLRILEPNRVKNMDVSPLLRVIDEAKKIRLRKS